MKPLDVFSEISRYRCCAVTLNARGQDGLGVGTGTALVHKGELFVVTCAHVAQPEELGVELGSVVFDGAPPVGRELLKVVFLDRDLDVALLHVDCSTSHRMQHLQPIGTDGLATMNQFVAAQPGDGHGYAFIGAPWDFKKQYSDGLQFRCLAYRTSIKENDRAQRLVLGYEPGPKEEPLPEPYGVSGSTVFVCDVPKNGELWTPGPAVAVQHSWKPAAKHLVCSPIAPIRDFLLQE